MMYRCDCNIFNPENNNYRNFFKKLILSNCYLLLQYKVHYHIAILLFEPGGLLDEFIIIKKLINYLVTNKINYSISVYIIESEMKPAIIAAHNFFTNATKKFNIIIKLYTHINEFKKNFHLNLFNFIVVVSLDPYYFLRETYYKNELNDISNIIKKIEWFLDFSLFKINSFFYTIELTFFQYNSFISHNYFIKNTYLGKNNNFIYEKKLYYYLNY